MVAPLVLILLVAGAGLQPASRQSTPPRAPQTTPSQLAQDRARDVARLRTYRAELARIVRTLPPSVSLPAILRPVMQLVAERTAGGHAAEESRAALLTLGFYVNGWPLEALIPEARGWPAPERRGISLRGRGDLVQHFAVSALIAAYAGTPMADAAGLYKETDDARRGSGFSFSDLAADRAGTMFGDHATRSPDSARRLFARLAAGLTEDDMMPDIAGLPDGLADAEFKQRYGGVNAAAYASLSDEINRRVANLTLFREDGGGSR